VTTVLGVWLLSEVMIVLFDTTGEIAQWLLFSLEAYGGRLGCKLFVDSTGDRLAVYRCRGRFISASALLQLSFGTWINDGTGLAAGGIQVA
jgi:hypothetical protein